MLDVRGFSHVCSERLFLGDLGGCCPWEQGFGCCATGLGAGCGGKGGPSCCSAGGREAEVLWTAEACQIRDVPVECQLQGDGFGRGSAQSHLALEITARFGAVAARLKMPTGTFCHSG